MLIHGKVLLFLLFVSTSLKSQLPFYDGFESGGFNAGGWVVSGSAGVSTQNPSEGTFCTEGPDTWGIVKYINSINVSILTVEFDAKASQLNTTCLIFRIKDNTVNTSAGIFFDDIGYINGVNGPGTSGVVPLFPYDIDTWYKFRFEMDMTVNKYDLYIDNILRGNDFSFFSPGFTDPYLFTWSSVATSGFAWVDDVKIYAGTVGLDNPGLNESDIFFYNNAESKLELRKDIEDKFQIRIFNTTGQLIQSSVISPGESVDLSNLLNGIYFIDALNENQNIKLSLYR